MKEIEYALSELWVDLKGTVEVEKNLYPKGRKTRRALEDSVEFDAEEPEDSEDFQLEISTWPQIYSCSWMKVKSRKVSGTGQRCKGICRNSGMMTRCSVDNSIH